MSDVTECSCNITFFDGIVDFYRLFVIRRVANGSRTEAVRFASNLLLFVCIMPSFARLDQVTLNFDKNRKFFENWYFGDTTIL